MISCHISGAKPSLYTHTTPDWSTNEQRAFPSLTTTAKHLHLDKRTVRKCNDILEQFKLIEKTAGGNHKANRYRILKPNLKILDKL